MRHFAALAISGLLAWAPHAAAQVSPRTIVGVVRDSAGRPLESAVISLDPTGTSRATRADAQGRFRFDKVTPGAHGLRTTWIGYSPDERTVEVPQEGLSVTIVLNALPYALDTLPITSRQTGLFGTVAAHGDLHAVSGADVEVIGTRSKGRTGADGRFNFPVLREGAYVVETRRDGFKTKLIPAPVPHEGAVEVAVVLDSAATKDEKIAENRYRDFDMRWHRRSVNSSATRRSSGDGLASWTAPSTWRFATRRRIS